MCPCFLLPVPARSRDERRGRALDSRFDSDVSSTVFYMNVVTGDLPWAFKGTIFSAVCNPVWCVSLDTAPTADLGLMYIVVPPWSTSACSCSAGDSCEGLCDYSKVMVWELRLKRKKANVIYL